MIPTSQVMVRSAVTWMRLTPERCFDYPFRHTSHFVNQYLVSYNWPFPRFVAWVIESNFKTCAELAPVWVISSRWSPALAVYWGAGMWESELCIHTIHKSGKFSAIQKTQKNHGNWIQKGKHGKSRKTPFMWLKKKKKNPRKSLLLEYSK